MDQDKAGTGSGCYCIRFHPIAQSMLVVINRLVASTSASITGMVVVVTMDKPDQNIVQPQVGLVNVSKAVGRRYEPFLF